MAVVGIVSEFDPFHNGHNYLVEEAKRVTNADAVVTVMSGSFTQRGMPSMVSKSAKTECALLGGVDIVLELPVTFALSSAERFAFGAVSILDSCGIVTHIAFGSECADIDKITRVARAAVKQTVIDRIKELMKSGSSFACARKTAVCEEIGDDCDVLDSPNDILAVEYVKALDKLNSSIIPVTIKRMGAMHGADAPSNNIASASFIRNCVTRDKDVKDFVPESTYNILCREKRNGDLRFLTDRPIMLGFRRVDKEYFSLLPEVREGLENRLYTAASICTSFDQFVSSVSCKRYTAASVRRIAMYGMIGITVDLLTDSPEYVRLLGATKNGEAYLKAMKQNCRLPMITKTADAENLLKLEIRASMVASAFAEKIGESDEEYKKLPIFTKYLTESKNKC